VIGGLRILFSDFLNLFSFHPTIVQLVDKKGFSGQIGAPRIAKRRSRD
jgi:hypothetical protein